MELLVAMAIFSVLGIALITLLRQSTQFLEKGQAGSEIQDILDNADQQFAKDFANVVSTSTGREGMPDVRFLCDRLPFDTDGDGQSDVWTQRLAFVRSVPGEAANPDLRNAGSKPGATAIIDGDDDSREAAKGEQRAAGGKMEVCWILVPGKKEEDPSVGTLYRYERKAVGGRDSYLPRRSLSEARKGDTDLGITTAREAEERLKPQMNGVLYLSYRFWSRHTKPDQARLVVGGRLADEDPPQRGGGGLAPTWDSTRGILPAGILADQFFLGKGPGSKEDPVDDVFPSRVRVTLVLDRTGGDARTAELAESIGPDSATVAVEDTRFAPGGDPVGRFLKIGREWIRWSDRGGKTFTIEQRGARGTKKESHPAGSLVRAGSTLVREFDIPAFREDWND